MCLPPPGSLHPHPGIAKPYIKLIYPSQHFCFARGRIYYELFNKQIENRLELGETILKAAKEAISHYALKFHDQCSDDSGLVDAELEGMLACISLHFFFQLLSHARDVTYHIEIGANGHLIFPAKKHRRRATDSARHFFYTISQIPTAQVCVLYKKVSLGQVTW